LQRRSLQARSLQRGNSYRRACAGIACALAALVASCANGVGIEGDVLLVPYPEEVEDGDDLDGVTNSLEPSDAEVVAGASEDPSTDGEDPNASPGESDDEDPEQVPAEGIPIDTEQDSDDDDNDDDDPDATDPDPVDPPAPSPSVPPVDIPPPSTTPPSTTPPSTPPPSITPPSTPPVDPTPPTPTNPPITPVPDPLPPIDPIQPPALPLEGHCLSAWEGSSCDTCSGQTQSDLLACRAYIDCYIVNECDPLTCGNVEQVCGVNSLGNGLAPKGVADAVYGCMCAP
jgi:hypothetical protein